MYSINKIIGVLINPMYIAFGLVAVALAIAFLQKKFGDKVVWRRTKVSTNNNERSKSTTIVHLHLSPSPKKLIALALFILYIFSIPFTARWLGATLEEPYLKDGRVPEIESYPNADYIELHGGSMGLCTNISDAAEMWLSADRVWMAARLWKAGKAPKIIVTSSNTVHSTLPLLMDFGVPTNAVIIIEDPRNTEEEARAVQRLLTGSRSSPRSRSTVDDNSSSRRCEGTHALPNIEPPLSTSTSTSTSKPKVLVVTSAWHMKRTMLMYAKYAPEVEAIPAPADWENLMQLGDVIGILDFVPSPFVLAQTTVNIHEWIGYFGYKYLRR